MSEVTTSEEAHKPFDVFELIVAILLGLAAIGAAVASLQSGQWGGKQLESFAEANAITTDAARSYSEAVSDMNSDYMVVGQAKRLIIEGIDADSDAEQERSYKLASYYLNQQLSEHAYSALKLPAQAEEPAGGEEEADTEEEVEAELGQVLPEETLLSVLSTELHDEDTYETAMFGEGAKLFEDADKKFAVGRAANDNGDKFDLAGLFFTIALFFAGLALVFKSRMRWGFCGVGALVFVGTLIYMMTLTWP
jgi:hypothetical protein